MSDGDLKATLMLLFKDREYHEVAAALHGVYGLDGVLLLIEALAYRCGDTEGLRRITKAVRMIVAERAEDQAWRRFTQDVNSGKVPAP